MKEADSYGGKSNLLPLPIMATAMYIGLTVLEKFPWHFNYLTEITPENAEKEYRKAVNMARILKVLIVASFLLISIFSAYGLHDRGSIAIIMVTLTLTSPLPLLYYALKK